MQQFDLAVIGGGGAGVTAALEAVASGARVALVERSGRYGGTCRYVGCVPSKTLLHTAQVLHTMRTHAAAVGLRSVEPEWQFAEVMRHKDAIVRDVGGEDGYGPPSDFVKQGGQTFTGEARFRSPTELIVGDHTLRAGRFIIATGSRPRIPPIDGLSDVGFLTWETIFDLRERPESLVIIGGGPLAVEFAQMFSRFGSTVTAIEVLDQIINKADAEAAQALRRVLEDEGITFHTGAEVQTVRRQGDQRVVTFERAGRSQQARGQQLMVAIGTQPNVESLNLAAAGVELTEHGSIKVDDQLRTSAPTIYACGDVATQYQFTHIATYEAKIAVANALHAAARPIDERVVPWAVYTEPSLAHVGLTEQEARDQGIAVVSATLPVSEIERSILVSAQAGLIKAVARRDTGELLGVDIVSTRADDLIHEAALAIRLRLSVRDLADTLHAYPTFSEGLQEVTRQLAAQLDRA